MSHYDFNLKGFDVDSVSKDFVNEVLTEGSLSFKRTMRKMKGLGDKANKTLDKDDIKKSHDYNKKVYAVDKHRADKLFSKLDKKKAKKDSETDDSSDEASPKPKNKIAQKVCC
jgi:hypothetical protein